MSEPKGSYIDVADAKVVPPRWVIPNLLPFGLTVVGAPPKTGKSTFTAMIATIIAEWGCKALPPWLSKPTHGGTTLIITDEADAGEIRYTIEKGLRVKVQRDQSILVAEDPWDYHLDSEDGMKLLMYDLPVLDPRLVVIDPFRDFHSLEEKDSAPMVALLNPLRKWAIENESAIVVVHHTTKPPQAEKNWQFKPSDLRGSGAIFGKADGVIMLTPNPSDATHLGFHATFKRAKSWESEIQLAIWDSPLKQGAEKLAQIEKTVLTGLRQGVSPKTAAQQLQLTSAKVREVLDKLRRNGLIK